MDVLDGGSGEDNLHGGDDGDWLYGGADNDSLYGQNGADSLYGGGGKDLLEGGDDNDVLFGEDGDDKMGGQNGDDKLWGGAGDDGIYGDDGNDELNGDAGNDVLAGQKGSDILRGGSGNDLYFYFGDVDNGSDIVYEDDSTAGNTDQLEFSYLRAEQLWFSKVNNTDLEVRVIGTNGKVTISNWYSGNQYHVEQFKSDSGMLSHTNVDTLVNAMAAFAPPAAGQTTLPANYQTQLAPVLAANWK
jgi:Ca2+-binding RTX toxin-like protein